MAYGIGRSIPLTEPIGMVKASPALSENRHLYPSLHSFLLVADSLWDPFQYSASISHSQLTIPTMSNMAATRHV